MSLVSVVDKDLTNTLIDTASNKVQPEDRGIHDWYRFVLSFPPHLVRTYLDRFKANSNSLVLDPFCGTGTTLVECKKLLIPSVGIEAHVIPHFATKVKIDWAPDSVGLLNHAVLIAETACREIKLSGSEYFALSKEEDELLLSGSISPLPLHKSLILLDSIKKHRSDIYTDHELLAFAKALIGPISNLHFGPEVGVGYTKMDADVVGSWLTEIRAMSLDLENAAAFHPISDYPPSKVYLHDSRDVSGVFNGEHVDIVITSPPYPNEKDYSRTTRLESVLLGFIRSRSELREQKYQLLRSNTRNVYKDDDDDIWVSPFRTIQDLVGNIERKRIELNKTSGFERLYGRVTKLYFGGIARHLSSLRQVLKPGAHLAYVLGEQASYFRIKIKTAEIVGEIAESLGYTIEGIELFRTRLATATREQLREEVLIIRW